MRLAIVERHNLPIVELQLVVLSGSAHDDGRIGLARVTAEMLKAGGSGPWTSRQLLERVERLGTNLEVRTGFDTTRLELRVTSEHFDEGVELVGAVARKPRFAPFELTKLLRREIERVTSSARSSGRWASRMVMFRELYERTTAIHPYSSYDALPSQLKTINLGHVRKWHGRHFTPKNAILVVVGDVQEASVVSAAERAFGDWKGEQPPSPDFARPTAPKKRTVHVVDRPGAVQSEVTVALLGPERRSDAWPALKTADQILGGGMASRLFVDVREKRSLAYSARSGAWNLARGPVPLTLRAETRTAKTAQVTETLLSHLAKMTARPPSEREVESAASYLASVFTIRMETVGALADMTARLAVLGLRDDYYDEYRRRLRSLDRAAVNRVAERHYLRDRAVVVVAGDASKIKKKLSRFGRVVVVDSTRSFRVKETLPMDPLAPVE